MPPTSAAEVLLLPSNEKEKMDSQKEEVKPHDIDFEASNLSLKQDFLVGEVDRYDGIIVDPSSLPADVQSFVEAINISLALWKSQERKVVWLKLPTANANLVYPAIEAGFRYHHAEPDYVMLTYRISGVMSTLPSNASHQVGVAAFVLNEQGQVLAVQEKNGPLRGSGIWKMPSGIINQGEDIHDGAVREVKEETGIETDFLEVIGFRQGHQVLFEKSDLFFLCVLRPRTSIIEKQDSEIEAAKWMDLEEFAGQTFFENNVGRNMMEVCIAITKGGYRRFGMNSTNSSLSIPSYFYYLVHEKA